MPPSNLPEPTLSISKMDARRFLLAHHRLWPPRDLIDKTDILNYIQHVGCIQFDPINIVGRNPDLVLQSRITGYRPEMLQELLYEERLLWDGWDKVKSIYLSEDWPNFSRHRALMVKVHGDPSSPANQIAPHILQAIVERGPLSSIDFKGGESLQWSWGQKSSQAKAALDVMNASGKLGVHHRVNTRRYYDLIERLLPARVLSNPDPNPTEESYQDWHVLRRIGGLGLANPSATEAWLGIRDVKSPQRKAALRRLVDADKAAAVGVEGVPAQTYFMRTSDLATLRSVQDGSQPEAGAAVIAALDNLTWDRNSLRRIFDFEYIWEVYKPVKERKYGYYVLPVLLADHFVARFEPTFDKKTKQLMIKNWWWEAETQVDKVMKQDLVRCFKDFLVYLGVRELSVGDAITHDRSLSWLKELL